MFKISRKKKYIILKEIGFVRESIFLNVFAVVLSFFMPSMFEHHFSFSFGVLIGFLFLFNGMLYIKYRTLLQPQFDSVEREVNLRRKYPFFQKRFEKE